MLEGIKRKIRAVQYGDLATRRRWFFILASVVFSLVVVMWAVYVNINWRVGGAVVNARAGVNDIVSTWRNFKNAFSGVFGQTGKE